MKEDFKMNINKDEQNNKENVMEVFKHDDQFSKFNALNVIQSRTNPNWVKQKGKGKNALDYVSGDTVTRMLNKAFNYKWSFYIKESRIVPSIDKPAWKDGDPAEPQPPVAQVLGSLVVPGWGVREQWGSQPLRGGADVQEHALKGAATDSMKKCASMFGIALDLYGQDGMNELMVTEQDFLMDDERILSQMKEQAFGPKAESATPAKEAQQETPQQKAQEVPVEQPTPQENTQQAAAQTQVNAPSLEERIQNVQENGTQRQPTAPGNARDEVQVEEQVVPKKQKPKAGRWADEDIQGLKKEKERLGIELSNNAGLNPYAAEFFGNPEATYLMITPTNAKDFIMFLSTKNN